MKAPALRRALRAASSLSFLEAKITMYSKEGSRGFCDEMCTAGMQVMSHCGLGSRFRGCQYEVMPLPFKTTSLVQVQKRPGRARPPCGGLLGGPCCALEHAAILIPTRAWGHPRSKNHQPCWEASSDGAKRADDSAKGGPTKPG